MESKDDCELRKQSHLNKSSERVLVDFVTRFDLLRWSLMILIKSLQGVQWRMEGIIDEKMDIEGILVN